MKKKKNKHKNDKQYFLYSLTSKVKTLNKLRKMITVLMAIIILLIIVTFTEKNPIKIRFMLIIISLINFTNVTFSRSKRWISLIVLLIFLGGIIIMFIILSSRLPNEKTKKVELKSIVILTIILTSIIVRSNLNTNTINLETTKWFINRSHNTIAITLLITIYFWIFNSLINQKQRSIRTLMCQYKLDL